MVKSPTLFVMLILLNSIVYPACQQQVLADPPPETPVERLRREGIRSMINGDPATLKAAGFNMTLPWERPLSGANKTTSPDSHKILNRDDFSEQAVEKATSWARRCRTHNIAMMYMMYVAAEPSVRILTGLEPEPNGHLLNYIGIGGRDPLNPDVKKLWPAHKYRKVVDWNGEAARWAPCPLEQRVWIGLIQPQLELVARTLQKTGASGGAALELETYCFYSIYPGMASQKKTFCFCDHCFYGFARSLEKDVLRKDGSLDAVLPRARFDWLTQRGLRPRYEQYLEDALAEIVRKMMLVVRRIDPDFLFGMYPYAPFWYYDALIRGSGTPELPCVLFPSAEYGSGYTRMADARPTFFGEPSTAASVTHLRRRNLNALYAGGIWNFSEEAMALAADQLVRKADGFWMYTEGWSARRHELISKWYAAVAQWSEDRPAGVRSDLSIDAMAAARMWVEEHKPDGITTSESGIVTRYLGETSEVAISAASFERGVAEAWQGRGKLPPVDKSVAHSGEASIRFEPSVERASPNSPYLDQIVPDVQMGQAYELFFWTRTAASGNPTRLWVGAAGSDQWPGYMWYHNYMLPPGREWLRLRTPVSNSGKPPLVLRFWCPPADGKIWLDDISLRPIEARTIDVPLEPPTNATGWGNVGWKLSPPDARCKARIVDSQNGRDLRISLYTDDSLAPLAAIVGLKPVVLRLEVYPSAAEPVILEKIQIRFTSNPNGRGQQ